MKITSINYINPSFTARKAEIRKADDIQRLSKQNFPVSSPSYMRMFYLTCSRNQPNLAKRLKANKIRLNIDGHLTLLRYLTREKNQESKDYIPYADTLKYLTVLKTGNCGECASTVIAALAANGYYDARKCILGYEISYVNTKTKETVYKKTEMLDHTFVLADMSKDNSDDKKDNRVIIDSWMGFADSISGAMEKYKKVFLGDDIKEDISYHRSMFRVEYAEKNDELIDFDNFELRIKPVIITPDNFDKEGIKKLGDFCRKNYKSLVLKDNNAN